MIRNLRLEKKGLRGLAIAESFRANSKKSILAGVVMRKDFVIDGFVFGSATLEGDDATDELLKMYTRLERPDVSFILISGIILSMYNIVNLKKISEKTQIPAIGVTYEDSSGIEDSIRHHFPKSYKSKLEQYRKLGGREKITLHTSYDVYIRCEGCTILEAKKLLDSLTIQGSVPEPLRVSSMLANSILRELF